ncbi:MAG: EAL domain-containing protein (putative c-di-GMP-specific phosphodiesterase class I) [Sulfurimonas sp.]|jgi:EAL domain-containing protein (putative c-di-GMP-specific phosphodiesterase class I)/GGDEF domain-containing protein
MKKIFSLVILVGLILTSSAYFYYQSLIIEANNKQDKAIEKMKNELLNSAQNCAKTKNLFLFEKMVENLQQRSSLEDVSIKIKNSFLNKNILFKNNTTIDNSWEIIEISIDAMLGYIEPFPDNTYKIILDANSSSVKSIVVKFQVSKDSTIKEFLFTYDIYKNIKSKNESSGAIKEEFQNSDFELSYTYVNNLKKDLIMVKTYYFLLNILLVVLSLIIVGFLFYNYFLRPKFAKNILLLSTYIDNIVNGKIIKDDSLPKMTSDEFIKLGENIFGIAKKYVNTSNELSITKDIIIKKERTDELTGLPNKKSFEDDLKYMFIANKTGFIIQLKIDKIGIFTKNNGPEIVDTLIEEFAYSVKHFLQTNPKYDGNIYRFFGGEFAMIIYKASSKEVEKMLQEIINITEALSEKYYFFENKIYYGATAFDNYGTIESILHTTQGAYENAIKDKSKFYFIVDEKNQLELNKKIEKTVKDVIARNDFVLQYIHDTYNFDIEPSLIMQEISPLIIDSTTFENIPTAEFISVAEKTGFINEFDKQLVTKALQQIEFGELEHKICIVLSVSSISNQTFLSWLEELLQTNTFTKHLIFTAPSYSMASNYRAFASFCTILDKYKLEFMIKQYNPNDLALEKLLEFFPSYIKVEKSFCLDFKRDSAKQHIVKKILFYSEEHDIKVIADSLKTEHDLQTFEMLGFYGTSK